MTTLASSLQEVQITTLLQAFKARTENSASVAGGICARTVLSAMYSINPLILSDRSVRAGIFSELRTSLNGSTPENLAEIENGLEELLDSRTAEAAPVTTFNVRKASTFVLPAFLKAEDPTTKLVAAVYEYTHNIHANKIALITKFNNAYNELQQEGPADLEEAKAEVQQEYINYVSPKHQQAQDLIKKLEQPVTQTQSLIDQYKAEKASKAGEFATLKATLEALKVQLEEGKTTAELVAETKTNVDNFFASLNANIEKTQQKLDGFQNTIELANKTLAIPAELNQTDLAAKGTRRYLEKFVDGLSKQKLQSLHEGDTQIELAGKIKLKTQLDASKARIGNFTNNPAAVAINDKPAEAALER